MFAATAWFPPAAGAYTFAMAGNFGGCRSLALGGAGVALGRDSALVWVNPAAPARMEGSSMTFEGRKVFPLGYAGDGVWSGHALGGVMSVGFLYTDAGRTTLNASDGSSRGVNLSRENMVLVGYAGALSSWLSAGFALRGLDSELVDEYRGSTATFDAGLQAQFTPYIKGGLAVRNAGGSIVYFEDNIRMPLSLQGGAALAIKYSDLIDTPLLRRFLLIGVVDAVYRAYDGTTIYRGGIENWLLDILALRVGGQLSETRMLGNLAGGIGIKTEALTNGSLKLKLDYSIRLFKSGFDLPQTVGLTVSF